jgi:hypothetical protein
MASAVVVTGADMNGDGIPDVLQRGQVKDDAGHSVHWGDQTLPVTYSYGSSVPSSPNTQANESTHQMHEASAFGGKNTLVWLVLAASLLLNIFMFTWQWYGGSSKAGLEHHSRPHWGHAPKHGMKGKDTDSDGIPDHHDFCPNSAAGFISGRATDFDEDGCADGGDDKDKDNDGVPDHYDSCPSTPQKYAFVSNMHSDFDGDGCADEFEDHDDDNDTIPDSQDICSDTVAGHNPDGVGCSKVQLERQRTAPRREQIPAKVSEKEEEPPSTKFEQWKNFIAEQGSQVLMGALLSAVLAKAHSFASSVSEQMPTPSGNVIRQGQAAASEKAARWRPSAETIQNHVVRIVGYCVIVYLIQSSKCNTPLLASKAPPSAA